MEIRALVFAAALAFSSSAQAAGRTALLLRAPGTSAPQTIADLNPLAKAACAVPGAQGVGSLDACASTLSTASAIAATLAPPYAFGPLTIRSITPPGLKVFQQNAPPSDADTNLTYAYFPLTDSESFNEGALVSTGWTGGHVWPAEWGLRSNLSVSLQANPVWPPIAVKAGQYGAVEYSTVNRAMGAQLARIAYHLGLPAHNGAATGYLDVANAYGFIDGDWIDDATLRASPSRYFTHPPTNGNLKQLVMLDKIAGPAAQIVNMPTASGLVLDYEVADTRTGAQTVRLIQTIAAQVRAAGYELYCYLNSLNSSNAVNEGLDATNLYKLHAACDYLSIVAWEGNPEGDMLTSLDDQIDLLKGPTGTLTVDFAKLIMTVGIGRGVETITPTDAATIRSYVTSKGFGGVNFWRYHGRAGGGCLRRYNQVIAIVLGLATSGAQACQ